MGDDLRGWSDSDVEAVLRDLDADELELLDPPDEVWEGIASAALAEEDNPGVVVAMEPRQRLRRIVLSAAAAVVLIAVGVTLVVTLGGDDPAQVVASAELAHDPVSFDALGVEARAGADLLDHDGRQSIKIVDASLPLPEVGADLEVWLIQPDDEGNVADLVSIGLLDPEEPGSLDVPTGYDPSVYFVVDISVEPRDGDASHSGRSILRGALQDV